MLLKEGFEKVVRLGPFYDCMFFSGVGVRFWVDLFLRGRFNKSSGVTFLEGMVRIGNAIGPIICLCVLFWDRC